MEMLNVQFLTFVGIILISRISAMEKRWLRSNTWNDPANWDPPRLPCPNDNIVLKQDVVYIENNNVTIKSQLALPIDGELIFGPNSNMVFKETPERTRRSVSTCSRSGVDTTFIGQEQKNWLNPMNWAIYNNGKKDDYLTKAAPFIERIPCITDRISFPNSNAFEIQISNQVTIKDIVLNQQVITDNGVLQAYLNTPEGKARFKFLTSDASLKLDSTIADSCEYSWCKCRDNKLVKSICQSFKCPKAKTCKKKVRPLNDCCSHCGDVVNINFDHKFNFSECWRELRTHLASKSNFAGVRLYMYPIENENAKVQILLSEDSDGTNADAAARYFENYLTNSSKSCGDIRTVAKDKVKHSAGPTKKGTIVLAVILTLFILALIAFGVYYFMKRRTPSTFKRQRFDNENDFTQFPGIEDVETDFSSPVISSGGTTQFANPLYELRDLDDNENGDKHVEEAPSPEYAIPVGYFNQSEKNIEPQSHTTEPRYVERPLFSEGLRNPSYSHDLDVKFDPDDVEGDSGNTNPLYDEVMKDYSEKIPPTGAEVDLDLTDEADSIRMKLELKVSDPSDSEEDGHNEFQIPEYHVPVSQSPDFQIPESPFPPFQFPESQFDVDGSVNAGEMGNEEPVYAIVEK